METIRSISCSIPANRGKNQTIDKLANFLCTSTHNVQNTNIAISLRNKCAEKPKDDIITKLDVPLQF